MIRPSPNEFERLKNEEIAKRRLIRLKEVRDYSKRNALKLRNLYKEQKIKVINKIAENIQKQMNMEDEERLNEMKIKHSYQEDVMGSGHNRAADWVDPTIAMIEQSHIDQTTAQFRHNIALKELYQQKTERHVIESARIRSMQHASNIERERAALVAALPPPEKPEYLQDSVVNNEDMIPRVKVCDRNKFSVIESFETGMYRVERVDCVNEDAHVAAEICQNNLNKLNANFQVQTEEQLIKAHLRGHQAIKKQLVHKDYQELMTDLDHVAKEEMAKRQRNYNKNELLGPSSAGFVGAGPNVAMMIYKEKCRERAVEAAVMESLKDITNQSNLKKLETAICHFKENEMENTNVESETKLSRLYDQIRRQKENMEIEPIEPTSNITQNEEESIRANDLFENDLTLNPLTCDEDKSLKKDLLPPDFENSEKIIHHALSATKRTDRILQKSSYQKNFDQSQFNNEQKHNKINVCNEKMTPSSTGSEMLFSEKNSSLKISSELSDSLESIVTLRSDSVMQIRDFQLKALMKLNGQLSMSQIYTLEKQFSDFSINSNSDQSALQCSKVLQSSFTDRNSKINNQTNFIVSEWVNTQLAPKIDPPTNFVSKSDECFLPDLNVSLKSSILRIKSESGTIKSEITSSSSSINTLTSSGTYNYQPSGTDNSAITKLSCSDQLSKACRIDYHLGQENLSSPSPLFEDNDLSSELNANNLDLGSLSSLNNEEIGDLIDFRSNTSEADFCDSGNDIPIDTKLTDITQVELDQYSNRSDIDVMQIEKMKPGLESQDQLVLKDISHRIDNYLFDNSATLISEYEQFLTNITKVPEFNNSIEDPHDNESTINDSKLTPLTKSYDLPLVEMKMPNFSGKVSSSKSLDSISEINIREKMDEETDSKKQDLDVKTFHDSIIYDTSTVKESVESIQLYSSDIESISLSSQHNGPTLISNVECSAILPNKTIRSELVEKFAELVNTDLVPPLIAISENNDDLKTTSAVPTSEIISLMPFHSNDDEFNNGKKDNIQDILSSTMKSEKNNIIIPSPDVSSIYSDEVATQLKKRIMKNYFEINKEYINAVLSSTNSSKLSFKSLESYENSTPRGLDSGNPSSRLTVEHSSENTARLTNDDIFVTPRNDDIWTDFTGNDEFSTPNANYFRPLSEYHSSKTSDNCDDSVNLFVGDIGHVDLDETIQNVHVVKNESTDLILFNSNDDLSKLPLVVFGSSDSLGETAFEKKLELSSLPISQKLSSISNSIFPGSEEYVMGDNVPSYSPSTESNSLKILHSFHSSVNSDFEVQTTKQLHEFECNSNRSLDKDAYSSVSDMDVSIHSLASFLNNEVICQELSTISSPSPLEKTVKEEPSAKEDSIIGNNKQMKAQLEMWKKERLQRINKDFPAKNSKSIIKDSTSRQKDCDGMKSRTLRLWNNLEEVQKVNQLKEAEKSKANNLLRKKQYAEKIRQTKMEKQMKK